MPEISSKVDHLLVVAHDRVAKSAVLTRLDDREQRAQVDRAKAAVEQAEANLEKSTASVAKTTASYRNAKRISERQQ
jgi:HlyD family secretion protein